MTHDTIRNSANLSITALIERYNQFQDLLNEVENAVDAIPSVPIEPFNVTQLSDDIVEQWYDVIAYSQRLNADIQRLFEDFKLLKQNYKQFWIKYKLTENLLKQQRTSSSYTYDTSIRKNDIDRDYNENLPARS